MRGTSRKRCKLQTESRTVHCPTLHCAHVRVPLERLPTRLYPDAALRLITESRSRAEHFRLSYRMVNVTYGTAIGVEFCIGALQLQLHVFQDFPYFRSCSCIFQGLRHNVAAGPPPRLGSSRVGRIVRHHSRGRHLRENPIAQEAQNHDHRTCNQKCKSTSKTYQKAFHCGIKLFKFARLFHVSKYCIIYLNLDAEKMHSYAEFSLLLSRLRCCQRIIKYWRGACDKYIYRAVQDNIYLRQSSHSIDCR